MTLRSLLCTALAVTITAFAPGARAASDPAADQPNPILVPGAPWYFEGFVVEVPDGEDWASFSKSLTAAELGRKFSDGRTAAVVVETKQFDDTVVKAEDLLRVTRRLHAAAPDPAAMKLASFEQDAVTPKGVLCAQSVARFEDRRPQYEAPGALVVRSLSCVRPDRPDRLVSLRFAERFAGVDGAPALTAQADRFLASLRFLPPDGATVSTARGAIANRRSKDALDLLQPAAEQGDVEAQLFLANLYLSGTGVEPDPALARTWYEAAARTGNRDALFNLGAIYDKAIGVQRDPAEALKWFTRAADQRDPKAQLNLAIFHMKGDGVPKDQAVAEQWLRRAAANGSTRATNMLILLEERSRKTQ